jgi:hypothetical protein
MYLNTSALSAMYLGDSPLSAVYLGSDLVWTAVTPLAYEITEIDSLEHDTVNATYNSLVKIDATHFILAYSGVDGDGFIKTLSIMGLWIPIVCVSAAIARLVFIRLRLNKLYLINTVLTTLVAIGLLLFVSSEFKLTIYSVSWCLVLSVIFELILRLIMVRNYTDRKSVV